jgi:hypothetical protein
MSCVICHLSCVMCPLSPFTNTDSHIHTSPSADFAFCAVIILMHFLCFKFRDAYLLLMYAYHSNYLVLYKVSKQCDKSGVPNTGLDLANNYNENQFLSPTT